MAAPALALGVGCAQVFGISTTSSPPADATPALVSAKIRRTSIGATVVHAPQDLAAGSATFLVADAADPTNLTRVPAMAGSASNEWVAAIATGNPSIVYSLGATGPAPRLYALPSRAVLGDNAFLEHPGAVAMPANASLHFTVTLPAPYATGEALALLTLGSWTRFNFTAPALNATQLDQVVMASGLTSITPDPLAKLTTADAVLVLRYSATNGNLLTGAFVATPFDQTGTDTVSGTMTAVVANKTLTATIDAPTHAARFGMVRPAVASPAMAWYLTAAPGYQYASNSGPQLDAAGVTPADTTISAQYGDPFTTQSWGEIVVYSSTEGRTYTPAGLQAVGLSAGMQSFAQPSPNVSLAMTAGLPTTIAIGQTALLSDGLTVPIDPTKGVQLSFLSDKTTNTAYQIVLYELVSTTPTGGQPTTNYVARLVMLGTQPMFTAPPEYFVVGHTYTLRAFCFTGGWPSIATGDLQTRTLPFAQAWLDSGVFTVTAM